jgi:hypothetical protein
MIIHVSILTNFKLRSIFGGSWGSIVNWLVLKIEPPSEIKLAQIRDKL